MPGERSEQPRTEQRDIAGDLAELLELIAAMLRQGSEFQGVQPQGANDDYSYKSLMFRTPLAREDT